MNNSEIELRITRLELERDEKIKNKRDIEKILISLVGVSVGFLLSCIFAVLLRIFVFGVI